MSKKLRIAFLTIGNSRRSGYLDGDTLRYGGSGGSGTDTTNILVAEYLASQGHEVVLAQDKLEPMLEEQYRREGREPELGRTVRGVQYTNTDFTGIDNKEFDILHTCLWFKDYTNLPIKVTKALIYHSHMQWVYSIGEMQTYCKENNLKFGLVHISNWEKNKNFGVLEGFKAQLGADKVFDTLIPNPVMDDVMKEVLAEGRAKKPNKFIFHAGWARGGNVALAAVRELMGEDTKYQDAEFHAYDYLMCTHDHLDPFFHRHNGQDKKTVFTNLQESEYFLYPLYTPYKDVHADTFSCVVAEAIAMGTIVITYPLAALPENFDGMVHWLPFPAEVDKEKVLNSHLYKDEEGYFNRAEPVKEAIKYLEAHPEEKEKLRAAGKNIIFEKYSVDVIGKQWVNFLNEMMNEA